MSNNNKYRAEMLKLMKESKMFTLPTSCRCGYKAKDGNWIDMEKHYETCAQFRNSVKMRSVELKQQIQEPEKSIGIQLTEKIVEIISELRGIEKEFKGQGYAELENMKSILSNGSYNVIKHALDNPNKEVKTDIRKELGVQTEKEKFIDKAEKLTKEQLIEYLKNDTTFSLAK